jgi:ABC-type sugar transport system ATPase subunit
MAFENMGNEQLIYLSLAAQTLIARRPSSETVDIGNEIGIKFSKDKIIFMDVQSGEVISR